MIFTRRSLQLRLDALRAALGDAEVDALAARLNRPGKDRMAAMWEVVVFHALTQIGDLTLEQALASGRRPDVHFTGSGLNLVADVRAVSDDGLDEQNPYYELSQAIEAAKTKLGLPIGGLDLQIHARTEQTSRGERRTLRLPERARIPDFVRTEITPRLREQMAAGQSVLTLSFDDDRIGIDLTIDPARSPYSTGGFAAYDVPTIKTRNPLYNALKAKAAQIRGGDGLTGVIVGDADCRALRPRRYRQGDLTGPDIAAEFLRQNSSVGFVLLLTVEEDSQHWPRLDRPVRRIAPVLIVQPGAPWAPALDALVGEIVPAMPTPYRTAVNGALRAREAEYDIGHHGGYQMSGRTLRISAREVMETLAGRRTLADGGAKYPAAIPQDADAPARQMVERQLREGRLPTRIEVIPGGTDEEDDLIEFTFGDPDPAISPFR